MIIYKAEYSPKAGSGKIGIALLTMVSVFLMVTGKNNSAGTSGSSLEDSNSLINVEKN